MVNWANTEEDQLQLRIRNAERESRQREKVKRWLDLERERESSERKRREKVDLEKQYCKKKKKKMGRPTTGHCWERNDFYLPFLPVPHYSIFYPPQIITFFFDLNVTKK